VKASVILVLGGALLPVLVAGATIYRCDQGHGVPRFQQRPCDGGEQVELAPLAGRWEPLREGERRLWQQSRRSHQPRRKPKRSRHKKDHASAQTCLRKRQRVEAISAHLRRGYTRAQGERLRRRRKELQEFMRLFCD
jgi:hypothetical protein